MAARSGSSREGRSSSSGHNGFGRSFRGGEDYWTLSARPLHTLIFLLPVIACYAVGSLWYLTDQETGAQQSIRAEKLLSGFFDLFGAVGLIMPGLAIIVVLLAWHIVARDRWHIRPLVIVGMVLEAALWSLPLLVFGALMQRIALGEIGTHAAQLGPALFQPGSGMSAAPVAAAAQITDMTWQARLSIALGAGLYEELLFRLVGIALIHFLVKDALKQGENAARVLAVVGTALAFALYHDNVFVPANTPVEPGVVVFIGMNAYTLAFYTLAGVYFACLYLFRGFGIVVAAHAVYDVFVLVMLAEPRA